jgi:hypothetical protein
MLTCQVAAAFTYEITNAELQQKVSAAMPLEIKKQFYTLVISNPVIGLGDSGGDVAVLAKIELVMPSWQATGNTELKGQLTYEPDTASFFLKNVLMKQVLIEGVPKTYLPGVKLAAQLAARKMFATHPIYVIKDDSMKARFAKASLKSVSTKDGKLILFMDIF